MIQNLTRDHRFGWWFETSPGKISSRVVFTSWVFWNQILGAPIVRKKGSSGTNDLAVIGVTRRKPEKKRSVSHGVESRGSTKMNLGFDFKWNFLGMFFVWLCLVWKKNIPCVVHRYLWGMYLTVPDTQCIVYIYLHLPYKRPAGYEGFCHPLNTRSCHDFHRVTVDGRNPKANHLGCVKPYK